MSRYKLCTELKNGEFFLWSKSTKLCLSVHNVWFQNQPAVFIRVVDGKNITIPARTWVKLVDNQL